MSLLEMCYKTNEHILFSRSIVAVESLLRLLSKEALLWLCLWLLQLL
jgi:hypothetical protein